MSRLEPKTRGALDPEQQEQYDRIARMRAPRADETFGGPFDPWVRSPELARRAISFGNFLWERTSLDRRIVELAICVTGRFWRSNVEWVAHSRMALAHGVAQETLDAIMDQKPPLGAPGDELLCYEICMALHEHHELPRPLYERAIARFGERGLVEIVGVIGYYTFVSMTLNAFEVEAPVDPQPFVRRAD